MTRFFNNSFFFIALFFTACASTPNAPPPDWAANVQSVYPRDTYITGRGNGSTRKNAEAQALAEIALYFIRETRVERSTRAVWTERDGVSGEESESREDILVQSHTRLTAVRYAEDPWFNPAIKAWETVAYIERNEGWSVFEPLARIQADAFLTLTKAAERETEPFNAVLRYGAADAYARSVEYSTVRDFAQVLHPAQAGMLFAQADAVQAALFQKQLFARERAVISVQSPVDHDRLIYQAMVKALGASGFAVESGGNAATVCIVRVEEGMQRQDSGITYYPSLTVTISGRNGVMMSFRVSGERAGAINPDVAKRRAYTSLAAALEGAFAGELQRWQAASPR